MNFPRLLVLLPLLTLGACSSSNSTPQNKGPQDPGLTPAGDDLQGTEKNPYGVAYPIDSIGFNARNDPKSTKPGDKIKNFKFLGYVGSDKTKGLTTVSLADFFDPEMRNYKVIHLSVAGVWCYWCKEETKALVPLIEQLKGKKVVYLTALSEDINHQPAKPSDLDYWVDVYKTNYTQMLDPGNRNLGPFFTSAGIPWNGNFDARTMEILSSITSAPAGANGQLDILGDIQPWLDWVDAHPVQK